MLLAGSRAGEGHTETYYLSPCATKENTCVQAVHLYLGSSPQSARTSEGPQLPGWMFSSGSLWSVASWVEISTLRLWVFLLTRAREKRKDRSSRQSLLVHRRVPWVRTALKIQRCHRGKCRTSKEWAISTSGSKEPHGVGQGADVPGTAWRSSDLPPVRQAIRHYR